MPERFRLIAVTPEEFIMIKLIHCSDLHLDSRMEANLTPEQARQRNRELCTCFARMGRYAAQQGVSVILIAGDLFDSERISATTVSFFLDTVRQLPQIDFLYLRGNHDEGGLAFAGRELPDNLRLFSHEWAGYTYDFLTVTGLEWDGSNDLTAYDSLRLDPAQTNIVTLHGQVSSQPGQELVCLPRLQGKHIDYLALGHIHSYDCQSLDVDSVWCYSGCLEGRGFDECGEKGFVLLEIEPKHIRHTFVPFATRTLYEVPVDITGKITVSELQAALVEASSDISSDSMVKFILQGSFTPDTQKDPEFLQQLLSSRFYFVKIKDESRLEIRKEAYEHDISLKGSFIRTVMDAQLTEEEKDLIICSGLQALRGEAISL